ncbi:hypothetical protein N0V92_012358 [Colletotrichum tropicale]|nr:hypothetical protein N0V92_012358 [Colletotrichum tropicale]
MTAIHAEPIDLDARIDLFIRNTLPICGSITEHADAVIENLLALEAAEPSEIDPVELRCGLPLNVQSALAKVIGYRVVVEKPSRAKLRKLCANWDVDQGQVLYCLGWSHGMKFWAALKALSDLCPSWTNTLGLLRAASNYRRTNPLFVARQGVDRNAPGVSLFDLRQLSQHSSVTTTQSDPPSPNLEAKADSQQGQSISTSLRVSVRQLLSDDSGICVSPDESIFSDTDKAFGTDISSVCSTMTSSTSGKRPSTEAHKVPAKKQRQDNGSESIARPAVQITNYSLADYLSKVCEAQVATAVIIPSLSSTFTEPTHIPDSFIQGMARTSSKIMLPLLLEGTHWVVGFVLKHDGGVSIHLYDSCPSAIHTQQASRILESFCSHYLPDCSKTSTAVVLQRAAPVQSCESDSDVHVFATAVYEFTGRLMPYKINSGLWRQSMAEVRSQERSWDDVLPVHQRRLDVSSCPVMTDFEGSKQFVEWSKAIRSWQTLQRSTLLAQVNEEIRNSHEVLAEAQEVRTVISLLVHAWQSKEAEAGSQQRRRRVSKAPAANEERERWQNIEGKIDEVIERVKNSLRALDLEKVELMSST